MVASLSTLGLDMKKMLQPIYGHAVSPRNSLCGSLPLRCSGCVMRTALVVHSGVLPPDFPLASISEGDLSVLLPKPPFTVFLAVCSPY